ncbi:phage tail tape measure protein [Methylobacterium iners]|uniref:Phage tail protein n=1 Tax=Methylobacterium iners TaxID=418707 RepID=A0ABQ4S0K8_9HYPH|nr:phage tail tape measure protein [Methylobacterium iners]GJD95717.1 hypothetical protein OCOJLMKI_2931 [Methylobacterium iners]
MAETETDRTNAARARQLDTLDRLAQRFGQSLGRAFTGNLNAGRQLDGVLGSLTSRLGSIAARALASPVRSGVTSLVQNLLNAGANSETTAFARGGILAGGRVRPFASGGVVAAPTYFPMQGGLGLMGEAGPEAILPLKRGSDGRLGVAAGGGPAATVHVTIQAQDVESFRRSEAQVAASLARAVARGRRAL